MEPNQKNRRTCPQCGEEANDGVTFCESCGTKLTSDTPKAPTEPLAETGAVPAHKPTGQASASAPENSGGLGETAQPQGPAGGRKRKRILLGVATLILLIGAAFAGGYFTGDDSAQVKDLQEQLAVSESELLDTTGQAEGLEAELAEATDEQETLAGKLKAERSIKGDLPAPDTDVDVSADADYVLGEAGAVGDMIVRPGPLEKAGNSGGGTVYRLSLEVKNDGNKPIDPYCGDGEVSLVDAAGRTFSGESTFDLDSPNCGDTLQPGLTKSGYTMDFTLPGNAKPALLELYTESYSDEDPVTWAVK